MWHKDGFSVCFYLTIQPVLLFVIPFLIVTVQGLAKYYRQYQLNKKDDVEELIANGMKKSVYTKQRSFHGFLYACQVFLHIVHILLPLTHILLKLILDHNHIAGVDILCAALNVAAWILGLHAFKKERFILYMLNVRRHSALMLTFWGTALLLEFLVFVSWNGTQWFTYKHDDSNQYINLVMFCLRVSVNCMVFILGFHAPGLKKKQLVSTVECFCQLL